MRISSKVIIGIDSLAMREITQYIGQDDRHKGKFLDIINILLEGLSNRFLYKREKLNGDINNVSAMRFFVGQENDRIYCQETSFNGKRIVILGALHLHKESNDLSEPEIQLIETLSKYDYEIEKDQKSRLEECAK